MGYAGRVAFLYPANPANFIFYNFGIETLDSCTIRSMKDTLYVYQIQGMLERPNGKIGGLRVLVCSLTYFESVDIPSDILDKELLAYLRYRSMVCAHMDVRKLPYKIEKQLRNAINPWIDRYVLENFK